MKKLRNWVLFSIVVLIWGSSWPVIKSGLGYIDPLNLVFQKFFLGVLPLSPLFVVLWRRIPRDRKSLAAMCLIGVLTGFFELSINIGMLNETSGIGAVLAYTQPFFVFCMAIPFLGEKAKISRFLGIVFGFIGVVVLSVREIGSLGNLYSIAFLIAGALSWAFSSIVFKRYLEDVDPLATNIVQLSVATLFTALVTALLGSFVFLFSVNYVSTILYLGVGAYSIAGTLWYFLLRDEEVTVLSSSSLMVPMVAFLFGWLLLGESIELKSLLGASLIIIGLYLVNRKS